MKDQGELINYKRVDSSFAFKLKITTLLAFNLIPKIMVKPPLLSHNPSLSSPRFLCKNLSYSLFWFSKTPHHTTMISLSFFPSLFANPAATISKSDRQNLWTRWPLFNLTALCVHSGRRLCNLPASSVYFDRPFIPDIYVCKMAVGRYL